MYSVSIDDVEAARRATTHLLQLGHKDIAYLGDRLGLHSDAQRLAGYGIALEEAGVPFRPELVVRGDGLPDGCIEGVNNLLSLRTRPTAIFCYNDMSALSALRVSFERGLRVPDDLSVIGFDDLFFASYLQPPLTTIRQPRREMGQQAMEMIVALLAGKEIRSRQIRVDGELIVRGSTAKPCVTHSTPA